jgi:hypothetical protein
VAVNRITRLFGRMGADPVEPVQAAEAPAVPKGFTACPPQLLAGQPWQQALYQWAYQQAVAASIYRLIESRFCRLGLG